MSNSVEIHVKSVPRSVDRQQWFRFVNKHSRRKKWLKHYKDGKEWVIVVKAHEKEQWKNALNGKTISNQRITADIKGGGSAFSHQTKNHDKNSKSRNKNKRNHHGQQRFSKHLTKQQQDQMLSLCSSRYNGENKLLNLGGIITDDQEHWASFNNQQFTGMEPMNGYYFDVTTDATWTHDPNTDRND